MHFGYKPKSKALYEIINDREESDDEADAKALMRVVEVAQSGVDGVASGVKKGIKAVFGYKQHTLID